MVASICPSNTQILGEPQRLDVNHSIDVNITKRIAKLKKYAVPTLGKDL
jgi:hypothetical protein